jgi:hypothetical protein
MVKYCLSGFELTQSKKAKNLRKNLNYNKEYTIL